MAHDPEDDKDNKHHNDGQRDAAEYNGYNKPHGWLESTFSSAAEDFQKDNEDYGKGWDNGYKQR